MHKITSIIKQKEALYFLVGVIFAYVFFPAYFEVPLGPLQGDLWSWLSLDPSWVITLNYANEQNLTWGQDFAFTCGPLSYLATRVGWGADKYAFLLYDLFIAFNFLSIFYLSLSQSKNKVLAWILTLSLLVLLPPYFSISIAMTLLAFLLFWITKSLEKDLPFYNVMQIAILVLLFYIKFNTGLVSFVFYFAAMVYKAIFKVQKKAVIAGYIALLLLAVLLTAKLLNVALKDYILSGLEFVAGYNDSMSLDSPYNFNKITAQLFVILPATLLLIPIFRQKELRYKLLLILFFYGATIFVLYKQAFVRADIGHIMEFFKFGLLFVFCIFPFKHLQTGKTTFGVFFALIAITAINLGKDAPGYFRLTDKLEKHYITGFGYFTSTSGIQFFPNDNQLPAEMLNKIGKNTIDIFPWNTHLLFENKLNYVPRPVMQSYAAYTPYLAKMNFEHYNSEKAPQYVIYDYFSIDNRYPLFDDAKVNLALMKNYKTAAVFTFHGKEILLLEKKKDFKPIIFKQVKEYAMYIDAPLVPREGVFYKVVVYNNINGKFISTFEHAPDISLIVNVEGQQPKQFRTSIKLLESGVFLNKFIESNIGFDAIMNGAKDKNLPIEYYNFRPSHPSMFKDKIRIKEYQIN